MNNNRKICPNCKKYYTPNDVYCDICGQKLIREDSLTQQQNSNQQVQEQFQWGQNNYSNEIPTEINNNLSSNKNQNKNNFGIMIAIITALTAILIIAVLIFVIVFINNDNLKKSKIKYDDSDSLESTEITTEESKTESTTEITDKPTEAETEQKTEPEPKIEPEPETEPAPASNKTFTVIEQACTWNEAKSYCESMGGHLAYIKNEDDLNEILSQVSSTSLRYLWVGGTTSFASDGSLTASWLDGESLDYINDNNLWFENEPSGIDYNDPSHPYEPYIMLWQINGQWSFNDNSDVAVTCYKSYRIGYVCEFD